MTSSYHLEDRGKCNKNTCANARNVPKLRFKGYTYNYDKIPLKNISTRIKRVNSDSTAPIMMISANCGFIMQSEKYSRDNAGKSLTKYTIIHKGELAYNHGASKAKPYGCCFQIDVDEARIPYVYHCFKIDKNNYAPYIALYLNNKLLERELRKLVSSSVRMDGLLNISYEDYTNIKLNLPRYEEQKKIASFLTLIDKKIEKQKELVELLKKYKRGLLSAIFSQKMRFKDDNGNNYPAWEEKSLGEVTGNISYGLNAASKDYDGENKYIRITDIDETTGKFNNLDIVSPDCVLSDDYKLKINDLLFARTGASTGKTYLYNENDGKMYFAGFLIKFSIKNEYCSNFIFYITQTFNYKKWVSIMSARSGQPGINAKEYSNYKFSCPVYDEQVKIANIISKLDNIIEKENILLDSYNDYKKGLLQKLFI